MYIWDLIHLFEICFEIVTIFAGEYIKVHGNEVSGKKALLIHGSR